ncbi:unnamed protein product, partial [Mesorhabditis belari]|uniref:Uncharacterized protein n=1 Tax=Mesorhabditis belari TaxID=2138241 RepID=A0AAF3EAM4_9BILA
MSARIYFDNDDGEYHSFVDDADPENDYDDHYNPNKHPNAYMERMQAVPFHGETTYQDAYPWKEPQIPKRRRSASGRDLPPFYDDTTNKVDYIPKVPKATKTFKPKYEGLSNEIPFHGQTSHKVDYVPRQAQRQKAIKKESNLGPSNADFHGKTLHQLDYDGRKGERAKPTRVQSEPLFPKTNTIDSTTHKASYVRLKNENCPAEAILNKARGWVVK